MFSLLVSTLGTPRIGTRRELKLALESFWSGRSDETALLETAAALRAANWARQKALGVTVIPSNDFSLYDHVLDTSVMVAAIPKVYGWKGRHSVFRLTRARLLVERPGTKNAPASS
jgi:5-methyltetrahydropteroyltriglutamate--homocysteine methyltransferase